MYVHAVMCEDLIYLRVCARVQVVSKHGHALERQLAGHLQLCPPRIWQAITPQLFAQLHHPQVR